MKTLAIIGCGGIGKYHLDHFLLIAEVIEMVGFCDLIPERAQNFQEIAGCGKAYTDYKIMLEETTPDMVFICIPPYCHGEIEFELIARNIPFFVEKPLTLDLDLARRIRDAVEEKGLITACGFQSRYSDLVDLNRDFVDKNQIIYVATTRIGGIPTAEWFRQKDKSGGQIVEQTIHQFDIMRYMLGEPEEVFTYATSGYITQEEMPGYQTDDLSTTVIRFQNGLLGTVATGLVSKSGNCHENKIIFSARDKRAELKILNWLKIYGDQSDETAEKVGGFVVQGDGAVAEGGDCVLYHQVEDAGMACDYTFIEAVITGDGSKIRSPYADAFKSLSFTLACNESIATGKPVKVVLE